MADTTIQRAGRSYKVDDSGISSIKRTYIVAQDAVMGADGEVDAFTDIPAIGSAHPTHERLCVKDYDVKEGTAADKKILTVEVNYAPVDMQEEAGSGQDPGVEYAVDEWGWNDGTDERELVTDADGDPVVNSAGDPFDTVPKVSCPAAVFTKVMKFKDRQTGWHTYHCTVNDSTVQIGGVTFPIATLLCTISEKRLIGNATWKYQYTVNLRYRSNEADIGRTGTPIEIGWDLAVTDAGMRELDANNKPQIIRMMDKETGKMCAVTSATLLNGSGKKNPDGYAPYNFRFTAYKRTTFLPWFYSEPISGEEAEEEEEE